VLAQEDWEIVHLPATAEEDETIVVDSLLRPRRFQRRRGPTWGEDSVGRAQAQVVRSVAFLAVNILENIIRCP
jgi:hypothetical protein